MIRRSTFSANMFPITLAMLVGLPGALLWITGHWTGIHIQIDTPILGILLFGSAIVAAAFLLSWSGEAVQKDISGPLALALVAIIGLLPEYAIEAILAWDAGSHPNDPIIVGRVAANVTGANRLLIGLGWSVVALVSWIRIRDHLLLDGHLRLELAVLTIATLLSFSLPIMHQVSLILAIVLCLIYVGYLIGSSRSSQHEPELTGPAKLLGSLKQSPRRIAVIFLFLYAAGVIIAVVEPFVESLIATGQRFGVSDFLLIQWLAPLASESPEILIAILFAMRGNALAGLTMVVSAEIGQLTVLIATMPIIFSLSAGNFSSLPLFPEQTTEFFLTSCFSLVGILLLARGKFGLQGASLLLCLFLVQLFFPNSSARMVFSYVYLGIFIMLIIRYPDSAKQLVKTTLDQLLTPLRTLARH